MKVKAKKCKGTGLAAGYGCGTMQVRRKYGLGLDCGCYQNWLLNSEEGKKKVEMTRLKAKNKPKSKQNKDESIASLIQKTRRVFQQYIRLRDANDPCISCGAVNVKIWHAGHYYKAELYSGLIFDENNVNKQCAKCNTYLSGNEAGYRLGLLKKYGRKVVEELDEKSIKLKQYKYDREELNSIKKKYQQKIKEIKSNM